MLRIALSLWLTTNSQMYFSKVTFSFPAGSLSQCPYAPLPGFLKRYVPSEWITNAPFLHATLGNEWMRAGWTLYRRQCVAWRHGQENKYVPFTITMIFPPNLYDSFHHSLNIPTAVKCWEEFKKKKKRSRSFAASCWKISFFSFWIVIPYQTFLQILPAILGHTKFQKLLSDLVIFGCPEFTPGKNL